MGIDVLDTEDNDILESSELWRESCFLTNSRRRLTFTELPTGPSVGSRASVVWLCIGYKLYPRFIPLGLGSAGELGAVVETTEAAAELRLSVGN